MWQSWTERSVAISKISEHLGHPADERATSEGVATTNGAHLKGRAIVMLPDANKDRGS